MEFIRLSCVMVTACLCVWIQPASAQGAAAEVTNAGVGEAATLTAPVIPNTFSVGWYRGTVVTLPQLICTCFASPPSQVNGARYTGRETCRSGGSLQIRDLLTNYSGNYTVQVIISGVSPVEANRQLSVYGTDPTPTPDNSAGLPVGAIVGIVIGVVAVVIIVCVLVYIFVIKKSASGAPDAGNSTEMAPNNKGSSSPKANGTAAEIQYSSVNFVPKQGPPVKPISPENTVYSEVRR